MTRERHCPSRLSRREFVRSGGALVATGLVAGQAFLDAAPERVGVRMPLPRRILGKTGAEVTVLGLGTAIMGHQNGNNPELGPLVEVFSDAIDRGINYIDTARMYGRAEEALAQVLPGRREKVFLVTKVSAETAAEAERKLAQSLGTLRQERVDLLHLHSVGEKDVDRVLGKGGAWEYLRAARESGLTRFLGVSAHSRPANVVRMIEEAGDVDVLFLAMNFVDRQVYGFEEKVLPLARRRKLGVMAMKVFGGIEGGFSHYRARTPHPAQMAPALHEEAIRYALSLEGVAGFVIGMRDVEQVGVNVDRVARATPLTPEGLAALVERGKALATDWGPRFGPAA